MNDKNLKLCEIFNSISGEGLMQGVPATFIRFSGCNMNCDYCDTRYHSENFNKVSVSDILNSDLIKNSKYFVVTGGEPFFQHEDIFILIQELSNIGKVEIETNGTNLDLNVQKLYEKIQPHKILLTVDLKLDSQFTNYKENFERGLDLIKNKMYEFSMCDKLALPFCCVKVVVKNEVQLDMAYEFSNRYPEFQIIVSPCYGVISATRIAEYIVEKSYTNLRMQIQLHKYLWKADERGK